MSSQAPHHENIRVTREDCFVMSDLQKEDEKIPGAIRDQPRSVLRVGPHGIVKKRFLTVSAVCLFFGVLLLYSVMVWHGDSKHSRSGFPIVINAKGLPTVLGIPLSASNAFFQVLGWSKIPVVVSQPYGLTPQGMTNVIQTLTDLSTVGVPRSPKPSGPSPYE